jgi:hypothetical protein
LLQEIVDRLDQTGRGDALDNGKPDQPALRSSEIVQVSPEGVIVDQHRAGIVGDHSTGERQHNSAGAAVKQGRSHLAFEHGDMTAYRRRGDAEDLARLADRAGAHGFIEGSEAPGEHLRVPKAFDLRPHRDGRA